MEKGGNMWQIIVYCVVIVLFCTGCVLFFVLKNVRDKKIRQKLLNDGEKREKLKYYSKKNNGGVKYKKDAAIEEEMFGQLNEENVENQPDEEEIQQPVFEDYTLVEDNPIETQHKNFDEEHDDDFFDFRDEDFDARELDDDYDKILEPEKEMEESGVRRRIGGENRRRHYFDDDDFDFKDEDDEEDDENMQIVKNFDFKTALTKSVDEIEEMIKDYPPRVRIFIRKEILARKNFEDEED